MFFPSQLLAQRSSKLDSLYEAQRRLDKEIKMLTQARDTVRAKKENTQTELKIINTQVGLREQFLVGLEGQMGELDSQIVATAHVIEAVETDIGKIQAQFAKLMVATYKAFSQRSTSFYLMSSKSVGEGYKRIQYFKAIQRMQAAQMRLLQRTKAFLSQKRILLAQQKVDKEKVVITEQMERAKLVALKMEQKKIFDKLKVDEAKLAKELQQSQAERAKLAGEIKKELDRIRTAKNVKIEKGGTEVKDIVNQLNKDFASNKGKFPWPIPMPNASITRHFGRQTLSGSNTEMDVQGIDLTTVPGQKVRTVFGGIVESVMTIPGQGKMVIISHGTYYTVFANLGTVSVTANEKVAGMATIGTARTDPASGETKLYFQMNQDKISLDPEVWLVKKG